MLTRVYQLNIKNKPIFFRSFNLLKEDLLSLFIIDDLELYLMERKVSLGEETWIKAIDTDGNSLSLSIQKHKLK